MAPLFANSTRITFIRMLAATLAVTVADGAVVLASRLPFQPFNASTGLAHDRVRCIYADSRGFLWFCTADGLSRFDGSRFVNYRAPQGLPDSTVEDFVEVAPGVYWVATNGGVGRLRSDLDPPLAAFSLGSDPSSNNVFALRKDRRGWLWIGTSGGLFVVERPDAEPVFRRVELDRATDAVPLGQVRALTEGTDGTIFIGTTSGVFRVAGNRVVREAEMWVRGGIRDLLADRSGRLWVGHDRGLTVFTAASNVANENAAVAPVSPCTSTSSVAMSTGTRAACRFDTIAQLPAVVRGFSEGPDGRIWIATANGLVTFNGDQFRAYTAEHGLTNTTINAAAEDAAGNVWIGTDAAGVLKLPREGFVSFTEADGLRHDYVTSIWQSRAGRVRARGPWSVISEFDGDRFVSSPLPVSGHAEGPIDYDYDVLEDRSGDLWIGTAKGLFRFAGVESVSTLQRATPKATYTRGHGLTTARATPAFADSRGDIWMLAHIGYGRRVLRWERSADRFHEFPETDVDSPGFRNLMFVEDGAGAIWFGSLRGLARYRDGRFSYIPMTGLLKASSITGLHVDLRGRLWVGTRSAGLYRTDDPAAELPTFTPYRPARGALSSETVWCVTGDGLKYVYIGTPQGVDRLEINTGHFRHYSVVDGLAGSEVISAFRDAQGILWFGTFTGISRLEPQQEVQREPPTTWIGRLRIRGIDRPLADLGEANVSIADLQPHQNDLQIDYFGLAAAAGNPITYQYQLERPGATWSAPTAERTVNYAELAPGTYRFLVRAINADGAPSLVPASVAFTIPPPIWRRWWFVLTIASLTVALGYALHKYRLTRALELERLRTRIASDLHDDLGSSLTQISILSEMVRAQLRPEDALLTQPLSRIGTLSRESVDSMSDIVWAIDPMRDLPTHLLQRMRHVAHELLSPRAIALRFEASGDTRRRLTADVRRHVYLIFKEALNNTVRHAEASSVTVDITIAARDLRLSVSDDGRGFDVRQAASGQGLRSMQRRASALGGSLDIDSTPATGTRVTLSVPVG